MNAEHNGAFKKPGAFWKIKRPFDRLKYHIGKAAKPGSITGSANGPKALSGLKPGLWHRFYITVWAPLWEDPWRWLKPVITVALLLGIGFCGAAIVDYFISGALDLQSIDDIKVVYCEAAEAQPAPQTEDVALPAVPEANGTDDSAMKAYLALKGINPDAAGWLSIPGTKIDYPVAQGQDNSYYLKHSFKKKKSAHACIFLDWRNEPDDLSYVIYGHDMKDRTFFGSLSDFKDEDFCREHQIIELNFRGQATRWKIFSVRVADDTAVPVMFESFDEYTQYLKGAVKASRFGLGVEVDNKDTILTLSTCSSGNSRLLLQAVRVNE